MRFQKQRYRNDPSAGFYGDCDRTAWACILDLDRDSLPNWGEHTDPIAFFDARRAALRTIGYAHIDFALEGTLEEILRAVAFVNPDAYWILGGTSRNGYGHSVVCKGPQIVWDPAQDDSGIVGPMRDGYYWATFPVPSCVVAEW